MAFYQSISDYYDFIFPPSTKQRDFLGSELNGISGMVLLEAGCGTGNLAFLLAERGAVVTGIDLDSEMILKARSKKPSDSNVEFENLDILKMGGHFPNPIFDGIVSFGNTIVHLEDKAEIKQFLRNSLEALRPGGKVMLQIINYDRILNQGINFLPTIENDKITFERYYDLDESDNRIFFKTVLRVKENGLEIKNKVKLLPLRKDELVSLIDEVGYRDVRFFGNFDKDPLTEDSVPLILSATKPLR
ncbi:class I SAM-dependent methyltransferase [Marinilabilia sp.]